MAEIIYERNGQEMSRVVIDSSVTPGKSLDFNKLPSGLVGYLRGLQPFVSTGNPLSIPQLDGTVFRTSPVTEVKQEWNTLVCDTAHSVYTVRYVGIDLDAMLRDGKSKGVNAARIPQVTLPFPPL